MCGDNNGYGTGVAEGSQFGALTDFSTVYSDLGEYEPLIKYAAGLPWYWWERSCYSDIPEVARDVGVNGNPRYSNYAADPFYGFAAACTIKSIY